MSDADLLDSSPFQKANPQLFTPPAQATPEQKVPKDTPPEDYTKKRFELAEEAKRVDDQTIAHLTALQDRQMAMASRHTPIPPDPKFKDIPKPEKFDYSDPIKVFQNPAVVLATLGSLFSRAPLTAALNAGGAAMEAYHKGEADKFAQKKEEWKEALDQSIKQNEVELERYNVAWKKSDAVVKDKLAQMQALAAGVKDEVLIAGIKTGEIDRIDKILEKREQATDKLKEIQARTQGIDNANVESTAQLIAENRMPPMTGWAMRSPFGQAVMARVHDLNPNWKAQDYYGDVARARTEATAEPRAVADRVLLFRCRRLSVAHPEHCRANLTGDSSWPVALASSPLRTRRSS